jgi:GNAT superfamily N-acetyltransferase
VVQIESIDTGRRSDVIRYFRIPFPIYRGCPQWVPPLWGDLSLQLNRGKHPFYEHSDADFFIAVKDGADAGRIAVLENKPYNAYHDRKLATFFLIEGTDDPEVFQALFDAAFEWARRRGLTEIMGPKGFGPLDGYGMLIEGFERRQTMMMSAYNHPYYPKYVEALGFRKEVDFVSDFLPRTVLTLPERLHRVAEKVLKRGTLSVHNFSSRKEMMTWLPPFLETYNRTFVKNWEYYPLTKHEVDFVADNIFQLLDHDLIKIITHKDQIVGFVLAFPDVSAALQRTRGYIPPFAFLDPYPSPWALVDILLEVNRTEWVAVNGAGILPEFRGAGGNVLLYTEMEKTVSARHDQFKFGELCQVAETTKEMRADLTNMGGRPYKNHRVYVRGL